MFPFFLSRTSDLQFLSSSLIFLDGLDVFSKNPRNVIYFICFSVIEHLPSELRDRFTELREMDLSVQSKIFGIRNKQLISRHGPHFLTSKKRQ
jgi:hypothetical protein